MLISLVLVIILVVLGSTLSWVSKQPANSQHAAFVSSSCVITSVFTAFCLSIYIPSISSSKITAFKSFANCNFTIKSFSFILTLTVSLLKPI